MHRIDGPNATPEGLFTEGNPAVGAEATEVTADIMNALQEELVNVIAASGQALNKPDNTQLRKAIEALVANAFPSGAVMPFGMAAVPTGWLKCNGVAVSRTTYARLFAAIGVTYGPGNGTTTFNVPDLRGEFVRGWDDGRNVDAARVLGSAQGDLVKAHSHGITINLQGEDGQGTPAGGAAGPDGTWNGSTNSTGGAENRPRNVALAYCIKT